MSWRVCIALSGTVVYNFEWVEFVYLLMFFVVGSSW